VTTNAPIEHIQDALKMDADHKCDLWEIRFRGIATVYRFWNGKERVWQGNTYEFLACNLSSEGANTDNQYSRPTLTVVNPDKIFGSFAAEGYLDLAEVIRKRVLQTHFINNQNLFEQRTWICARPSLVNNQVMQLELRSTTDMPAWKTPARTYSPPEFPFVVI
jgi:phage-related protein